MRCVCFISSSCALWTPSTPSRYTPSHLLLHCISGDSNVSVLCVVVLQIMQVRDRKRKEEEEREIMHKIEEDRKAKEEADRIAREARVHFSAAVHVLSLVSSFCLMIWQEEEERKRKEEEERKQKEEEDAAAAAAEAAEQGQDGEAPADGEEPPAD